MLSRRKFITGSTATVAATASGTAAQPSSGPGPLAGRVKIAVKYQMINEPDLSVVEKFRLLEKLGFDGTELRTADKKDAEAVVAAIEETGLPVHGIINSSDPDIVAAVDLAARCKSDSVLVLAAEQKGFSYEENFVHWQKLIRKALSRAEETGVKLCIENVRATFLKTAEGMAEFIDSFDSPVVRSYFDLGNTITWTEQLAEHWAKVLGKRVYKLDIKDRGHPEFGDAKLKRKGIEGGTDGGEVNWAKVREILVANEFSGWATAEVAGGNRERLAGIAAWMRDVLDLGDA
jgi:hexulose-6-phosphate isomerase